MAKAKPRRGVITELDEGSIVSIGGRVAVVAWHYTFRGDRESTSVRWWISPSNRWSEPESVPGDTAAALIEGPPVRERDAGVESDPLVRAMDILPLVKRHGED